MLTTPIALDADEIEVDSFAGGGGASFGIEMATGRSPAVAINHDAEAIALHKANHPHTEHHCEDVWQVDPVAAVRGRRVGLFWASPDCKHFSKAKGGKPLDKEIRGLAWSIVLWAATVRPRIISMENVEEFRTWSPLLPNGRPDPARKGETFDAFCAVLTTGLRAGHPAWAEIEEFLGGRVNPAHLIQGLGYRLDWRELRGCDFGAPTVRKRFFLVARCDDRPITWPTPTHGPKRARPVRTAAECIDWSLPCPSIFLTAAEGKALGVRRPLAEATLRRIGRGIRRFVIESGRPFIVPMQFQNRPVSADDPLQTVTTQGNKFNLVAPVLATLRGSEPSHIANAGGDLREPLRTVAAGGTHAALVTPYLATYYGANREGGERVADLSLPLPTQPTENRFGLVAPILVPRYGERAGQAPRTMPVDRPMPTIVPTSNGGQLVAAFLAKHYGDTGQRPGSGLFEPVATVTAQDHHALVASHLVKLSENSTGQPVDQPLHTVLAGAARFAEVRAFLVAYYGNEKDGASLLDPVRTVTARDRLGLVTVQGEDYAIVDIGMRMLTPRELFRAQGFPDEYLIDVEVERERRGKLVRVPLSKGAQVRMCGNSVCPDVAEALVRSNYRGTGGTIAPRTAQVGPAAAAQLELRFLEAAS